MSFASPNRRSPRLAAQVAAQQNLDPYPHAPIKPDDSQRKPSKLERSVVYSTYCTFLSRRHLHCYILYLGMACLAYAYLFCSDVVILSLPALAWYSFFRPKIQATSEARPQEFLSTTGTRGAFFLDMAAVYAAETGFKDEYGRDIMGLYAKEYIRKGSCITEYGRVVTSDTRTSRDQRWYNTVNNMTAHFDGNPAHPLNGGISGLAYEHCLGSIINHSANFNAEYERMFNAATPRAYLEHHGYGVDPDETGLWSGMIVRATDDILPDHQILCNYEKKTAKKLWVQIVFKNESLQAFLRTTVSIIKGHCSWILPKPSEELIE